MLFWRTNRQTAPELRVVKPADNLSGDDSDDSVMQEYKKFIEKETIPETVVETSKTKKRSNDSNEELIALREENKRLKKSLEKCRKESHNIIAKAVDLKQKDKTSVLQLLELFRLNHYLIRHLPDSQTLLEEYINGNGDLVSSTSSAASDGNRRGNRKKSVNQMINYFPSLDKSRTNGSNVSDSDGKDMPSSGRRTSPRKAAKSPENKRKPNEYISSEEDSDIQRQSSADKRVGRPPNKMRKTRKPLEKVNNESTSQQSTSIESTNSQSKDDLDSNTANDKPKRKPGPKRSRRRVVEPKGYFPCTFDPKQCNEIMDTKEHFEFHMSGHYDAKYVCPFCAYTGPNIQIIKRHINNEREGAEKDKTEGKPLTEDRLVHKDRKIYQCFGCKVCDKIYDKFEKRCDHINEDSDNECEFRHDIDYEFKDHLKRHFNETYARIKSKEERLKRIKPIIDNFVEDLYFQNNAKKTLLVQKYSKGKEGTDDKCGEESSDLQLGSES